MQHLPEMLAGDTTEPCGTLIHTAVIAGRAIEADAVGARITGEAPADDLACVCLLEPTPAQQPIPELQNWPLAHDAPFSDRFMQNADSEVFRIKPQTADDLLSFKDCFGPLEALGGVVDAVGMRFVMPSRARCAIVYLRLGRHASFGGNNLWMLKHLYPVIVADAQQAYGRYVSLLAGHGDNRFDITPKAAPTLDNLLARLSKTELQVLDRLRLRETEREVAQAVGRSPHTIHVHVKSIYRKLMVNSRRQLLATVNHTTDESAPALNSIPYGSDRA